MKLKFLLVPLVVLGFALGSCADVKKDKGFVVGSYADIKKDKRKELEWISPTQKICKANGGKMHGREHPCRARWSNANDICRASGARLPSIHDLRKLVVDCGGKIKNHADSNTDENMENTIYQNCYKNKGFIKGLSNYAYWSSTRVGDSNAWYMIFFSSYNGPGITAHYHYVRCVRDGS